MTKVTIQVTELPESRVRVEAEVSPDAVDNHIDRAAKEIGRSVRIAGFRSGMAPTELIMQRVGSEQVMDQAVRRGLPEWYEAALTSANISPIGEPDVDFAGLPERKQPFTFSFEIGNRPIAKLGEYKGIKVDRPTPEVQDAVVEEEIEKIQQRLTRSESTDDVASNGCFVVIDFVGSVDGVPFDGGAGVDQMLELGSGRFIPGFEEQLVGAKAGEERTIDVTFPEDYAEQLAGKDAQFAVTVKEVQNKVVPPVDDELALSAGFDDLTELKSDIREQLTLRREREIESEFRMKVLDTVVEKAVCEVPDGLIAARAKEELDSAIHNLSHQGIDRETFYRISGKQEEELLEEGKESAEKSIKREAVLAAIVDVEKIDPTDADLLEEVSGGKGSPKKILAQLRSNNRLGELRERVAQQQALELIVSSVKS